MKNESLEPVPFIVGSPRSGTTLLRNLLDVHPDIFFPAETNFVPRVLQTKSWFLKRTIFEIITAQSPMWPLYQLDINEFKKAYKQISPFTRANAIRCFFQTCARKKNKKRWGSKTPGYAFRMDLIAKALPEVKFIHLIRDGRAVLVSLKKQWFRPSDDTKELALYWKKHVDHGMAYTGLNKLTIHFENLVLNTPTVLASVCDFIDLDYYDGMIEHGLAHNAQLIIEKRKLESTLGLTEPYFKNLLEHKKQVPNYTPIDRLEPSKIESWRNQLTEEEIITFERYAGDTLLNCGYKLSGLV